VLTIVIVPVKANPFESTNHLHVFLFFLNVLRGADVAIGVYDVVPVWGATLVSWHSTVLAQNILDTGITAAAGARSSSCPVRIRTTQW